MRLPLQPAPREINQNELPTAIWLPNSTQATLPSCYQGSPLEMVQAMVADMNPKMGVNDGIDYFCKFLREDREIGINLPAEAPEENRSHMFVWALLTTGVAETMPQA